MLTTSTTTPSHWLGGTEWTGGVGAARSLDLLSAAGALPVFVIDSRVYASEPGRELIDTASVILRRTVEPDWIVDTSPTIDDVASFAAWLRRTAPSGIVALGGGSTIDLAMLAALNETDRFFSKLCNGRSGLGLIPPTVGSRFRTVALPTTLGTGAEVSSAACCDSDRGKHLLLGRALRPDRAIVDPTFTRTIDVRTVNEAVVEILARIVVPFSQVPRGHKAIVCVSDLVALASLSSLSSLSSYVSTTYPASGSVDDDTRLGLATISAHTHAGWGQVGRHEFSSPVWFLATELATVTGWSKAQATALLLPVWTAAVLNGDHIWGDADRLELALQRYAGQDGLVRACSDAAPSQTDRIPLLGAVVAERVARRWGAGLPMMSHIPEHKVAALIDTATDW
jgi:alcohol dehydrogenase